MTNKDGRYLKMVVDVEKIAEEVVAILAPCMPYLIEVSKSGGKKIVEKIAEKSGEAAWDKANKLWGKLKGHFTDNAEIISAINLVTIDPNDRNRLLMLSKLLGTYLHKNPVLTQEIMELLGGREEMQQVLSRNKSLVHRVEQHMNGKGHQLAVAEDESIIMAVIQKKEK